MGHPDCGNLPVYPVVGNGTYFRLGLHDFSQYGSVYGFPHLLYQRQLESHEFKDKKISIFSNANEIRLEYTEERVSSNFVRLLIGNPDKNPSWVQTFENEVVDLELLKEQMVFVYKMLDFIYEMPELDIEIRAEMMMDCY